MLEAGDDPLKVIEANKLFWSRKYEYISENDTAFNMILFNTKTRNSYHPWNGVVMGEAFGDSGISEIMPVKDYLDSPPIVDDFLYGLSLGKERALKRKAEAIKKAGQKDPKAALGNSLSSLMKEGNIK